MRETIWLPHKAKRDCDGNQCCYRFGQWLQHMEAFVPIMWISFYGLCGFSTSIVSDFSAVLEEGPYFPAILTSVLLIVASFFLECR
jgi:hypothetical protein